VSRAGDQWDATSRQRPTGSFGRGKDASCGLWSMLCGLWHMLRSRSMVSGLIFIYKSATSVASKHVIEQKQSSPPRVCIGFCTRMELENTFYPSGVGERKGVTRSDASSMSFLFFSVRLVCKLRFWPDTQCLIALMFLVCFLLPTVCFWLTLGLL
jgi:hypothetical protein